MTTETRNVPIVVVADMAGPLVLRNPLHLDGLLLAAREKRDGVAARGTPFPALSRTGGVFNASAGALVVQGLGGVYEDTVTRVRRLDFKRDGEWIAIPANSTKQDRSTSGMSPYRPTMETERVIGNVSRVVWQALGDPVAIKELLGYVGTIGKQYATGWGEVDRFTVLPSEAVAETCGLAAGNRPLRSLPVDLARKMGVEVGSTRKGRLEPPYAVASDLVDVCMPTLDDLTMSAAEVDDLFACAA